MARHNHHKWLVDRIRGVVNPREIDAVSREYVRRLREEERRDRQADLDQMSFSTLMGELKDALDRHDELTGSIQ